MPFIDKIAWIHIKDRRVLFARSRDKDVFYLPGGKRENNETDIETLCREITEELSVTIVPSTAKFENVFESQAHGMPLGVLARVTCYTADFEGTITPSYEIEEIAWLSSSEEHKTVSAGILALHYLRNHNLID